MAKDINQLIKDCLEYISENRPQNDWVSYSGPILDDDEYAAALRVILQDWSKNWLIFGKKAREFELEFPKYLGTKFGSYTNSGSSANLLAISSLTSKSGFNLPKGSKVLTPVVCFPTTLNPIIQSGLKPVFVDVTLPDLNLDLDQTEELLKKDPDIRAIVFAHVLGNPPDMERVMMLVDQYDLVFIEDACDALGSFYDGQKLGSFGHISTCSFFPAHHMTTGEGGFVATNRSKLRKSIASLRDWGRACYCNTSKPGSVIDGTACGNRFKNWLVGMPDTTYDHRYVFDEIGYNLKPLDIQAAIGLEQLKKLPYLEASRRKNFDKLQEIFSKYEDYFHLPQATEKSDPCWFAYLLTVKKGSPFTRQQFVDFLEENKIQTRSYFSGNILAHPGYNHLADEYEDIQKEFPIATYSTINSFFLGTYAGINDEKMAYIGEIVDKFFEERV
tara:strand:+ start:4679 stop:6010 length:1332 start_codon:yes stop_codon:yes gene_type:complete